MIILKIFLLLLAIYLAGAIVAFIMLTIIGFTSNEFKNSINATHILQPHFAKEFRNRLRRVALLGALFVSIGSWITVYYTIRDIIVKHPKNN
jgi:hypothetical protein